MLHYVSDKYDRTLNNASKYGQTIAYNIGVYESVQKFGALIINGKISNEGSDVSKIAQLLSEASAFYDSEIISQLINTMVRNYRHRTKKPY